MRKLCFAVIAVFVSVLVSGQLMAQTADAGAMKDQELAKEIAALRRQDAELQDRIRQLEARKGHAAAPLANIGAATAMAAATPPKAPTASTPTCRLPSATSTTLFECPGLSVSFGAMTIHRETTDGVIVTPTTPPGTIITGDDFNFPWSSSPDLVARYRFGGGWSVEGRYFYSHPSDATFGIPSITTFRLAGIGVTILGSGPLSGTYSSRFDSAELNMWKELIPGLSVGAGYRRIDLKDSLHMTIASPGIMTDWDDTNRLNGGQAGLSLGFVAPSFPLHLSATFKGGVYANSASNTLTSQLVSGNSNTASKQALSAEADLTATYYLTDRLNISANYMALWLNNVALADAAAQSTVQAAGGSSSPVAFGKLWYNAASLRVGYDF